MAGHGRPRLHKRVSACRLLAKEPGFEEAAFALVLADVIGALTELRACAPVTGAVGVLNELRAVVGRAEDGAAAYAPTVTVRPTYSDHSALRPGQTPTPAPSRVSTPQPTPPTEPD